ncbi:MAG: uracil-DNA glycosylase family protein [Bacteroidales bacterium]|nr:uracil-DNA glycosylase family protein [Bacteroidales bacterium]
MNDNAERLPIETHPWQPWLPASSRVLIMGTFPPGAHRWSMDFYYPNPINDFWRIIGLIFSGDRDMLYDPKTRAFDLNAIKHLLDRKGIAMSDTVYKARRLAGNAADKFLDVVEPNDIAALLERIPMCRDIATTGEKAAMIAAEQTGTDVPRMGAYAETVFAGRDVRVWRMPSTSRAYPLKIDKKAAFYADLLRHAGIDGVTFDGV